MKKILITIGALVLIFFLSWRLISNTANPDENPSASQTDTAWKDQEKTESGSHEGDLMGESSKDNSELYEKTNPVFNTAKTTLFQLAQQGNPYAAEISEKMGLTEDTQKSQSLSMTPEEEMTFRIIIHSFRYRSVSCRVSMNELSETSIQRSILDGVQSVFVLIGSFYFFAVCDHCKSLKCNRSEQR